MSAFITVSPLFLTTVLEEGIAPILKTRTLRLKEVEEFTRGHSKWVVELSPSAHSPPVLWNETSYRL